jgi:hypothetical protein
MTRFMVGKLNVFGRGCFSDVVPFAHVHSYVIELKLCAKLNLFSIGLQE